jgi:hypothetical protein
MISGIKWTAWPLVAAFTLIGACLDPVVAPLPVVKLRAPASPVEMKAGASALLAVQAVDVQDHGVDGARVTFVRVNARGLTFDAVDPAADSVVVTTASGLIDGVQAVGVASARVLAVGDAALGDTSVVAVVSGPTASPTAAVAVRISVRVTKAEAADGGEPSSMDSATDDGASGQ